MWRSSLLLIGLIILALVCGCSAAQDDFKTITNTTAGISFEFPKDWQSKESTEAGEFECMAFLDSEKNRIVQISIAGGPNITGLSLEDSLSARLEAIETGAVQPPHTIIAVHWIIVGGYPAWKLDFEYEIEGRPARVLQVLVIKGDLAFSIIYWAFADEFERYRATFDRVINSITFIR